ncbi:MAG: hypothetical protein E7Z92_05890 [Cyanobacteria bacterium SIG31]|nr:hypothetical protein [Cyanobacteria bacterium SIG31]
MQLTINKISPTKGYSLSSQKKNTSEVSTSTNSSSRSSSIYYNILSFKGYYGDKQPVKKLFYHLTGRNRVYEDKWTQTKLVQAGIKKWVNAHPIELIKRSAEQAIQSICTITKPNKSSPKIPAKIQTPNFGNNWGRNANYIEINPRVIAKYSDGKITDGLLQVIKLLPAIPTSPNSAANCIVLSQLYPTHFGDGTTKSDSLYTIDLHTGISNNLTCEGLWGKVGADEQVKAFNDLAHLMGFKTGFRMVLSSGQLRVQGKDFSWKEHEKAFIDACIWGIELGFDSIYFDSAKHIIDPNGYLGVGELPNKKQMAYILHKIREETRRNDLSFIGEKCDDRNVFKKMGFTAGTDWSKADNYNSVKWESLKQSNSREYAAGPEVSNDNDDGTRSYKERLERLKNCLFAFNNIANKLPSYMQLHDLMPLAPQLNTHDLMMKAKQIKASEAWTECERHWDGVFATTPQADEHRNKVYNVFKNFIRMFG